MTASGTAPAGAWTRAQVKGAAPPGRGGHCMAALGGKVVVFGGADRGATPFADVHVLDLETLTWRKVVPEPAQQSTVLVCRTGATMTAIGTDVFIYGGQEPSTGVCFSEVVKIDTTAWVWSVLQPASGKPPARHSHCAGVAHEHALVVYGGASQQSVAFGDVWLFNTKNLEWTRIEVGGAAPAPREMATGTMLSAGRMLIAGGRATGGKVLRDCAVLDLDAASWSACTAHAALARCAHAASTITLRGEVVGAAEPDAAHSGGTDARAGGARQAVALHGGFTGTGFSDDLVLIDVDTREATVVPSSTECPAPRFAHAACAVPWEGTDAGGLLVFGGVSDAEDFADAWIWHA